MICSKCNATIPDGSTTCPECHAEFEKHIGSFAGSVHWEDEVKTAKTERERKRTIIICCIILVVVIGFWLLQQTGALGQLIGAIRRLF